jgi:hypothetical protein
MFKVVSTINYEVSGNLEGECYSDRSGCFIYEIGAKHEYMK